MRPLTANPLPCVPGFVGLIVATSNAGDASAAIAFGRAAGSGIAHAVSLVARFRVRDSGASPWVQVPAIEVRSAFRVPSKVPPIPAIEILTVEPCRVTALAAR